MRRQERGRRALHDRAGFGLVEAVIALLVFSVAVLGVIAGTVLAATQLEMAQRRTARQNAERYLGETLRARGFAAVDEACGSGEVRVGEYRLSCEVTSSTGTLKRVRLISSGPARRPGEWDPHVADTTMIAIARRGT